MERIKLSTICKKLMKTDRLEIAEGITAEMTYNREDKPIPEGTKPEELDIQIFCKYGILRFMHGRLYSTDMPVAADSVKGVLAFLTILNHVENDIEKESGVITLDQVVEALNIPSLQSKEQRDNAVKADILDGILGRLTIEAK